MEPEGPGTSRARGVRRSSGYITEELVTDERTDNLRIYFERVNGGRQTLQKKREQTISGSPGSPTLSEIAFAACSSSAEHCPRAVFHAHYIL